MIQYRKIRTISLIMLIVMLLSTFVNPVFAADKDFFGDSLNNISNKVSEDKMQKYFNNINSTINKYDESESDFNQKNPVFLTDEERNAVKEIMETKRMTGIIGFDDYDLESSSNISVIVEFVNKPAKFSRIEAAYKNIPMTYSFAEDAAMQDHIDFKDGLGNIFQESANSRSGQEYEITSEYFESINGVSITLPAYAVKDIAELECVNSVYPNLEVKIDPSESNGAYETFSMNNEASGINAFSNSESIRVGMEDTREYMGIDILRESYGLSGAGVKVAVLDTGIDYNHPDLKDVYVGGMNLVEDKLLNIYAPREKNDPMETTYSDFLKIPEDIRPVEIETNNSEYYTAHGTHVSGTIAGSGKNLPVSAYGMAPNSELFVYRVLGPYGSGLTEWILNGLEDIASRTGTNEQFDVVNMSLGANGNDPYFITSTAVNNIMVMNKDIVFAISSGNSGPYLLTLGNPGSSSLAITVGNGTVDSGNTLKVAADVTSPSAIALDDFTSSDVNMYVMLKNWENKIAAATSGSAIEITGTPIDKIGEGYKLVPLLDENGKLSGIGVESDYTDEIKKAVKGNIVVVLRGNTFTESVATAKQMGAGGVLVVNYENLLPDGSGYINEINFFRGYSTDYIPMFSMSYSDWEIIQSEISQSGDCIKITDIVKDGGVLNPSSSRGHAGKTFDIKPDVVGPGTNVLSTVPYYMVDKTRDLGTPENPNLNLYDYSYASFTGTSMSSPHIAGIAALMVEYSKKNGERWSAQEIKSRLITTAKDLNFDDTFNPDGYSVHEVGGGYVQPINAIEATLNVKVNYEKVAIPKDDNEYTLTDGLMSSFNFGYTENSSEDFTRTIEFNLNSDTAANYNISVEWNIYGQNVKDKDFDYAAIIPEARNLDLDLIISSESTAAASDSSVLLNKDEDKKLYATMVLNGGSENYHNGSYEGYVVLTSGTEIHRIPFALAVKEETPVIYMHGLQRPLIAASDSSTKHISQKTFGIRSDYSDYYFVLGCELENMKFVVRDRDDNIMGELGISIDLSGTPTQYLWSYNSLIRGYYYPYIEGEISDIPVNFEPGYYKIGLVLSGGDLRDNINTDYSFDLYVDDEAPVLSFDNSAGTGTPDDPFTVTYTDSDIDTYLNYLSIMGKISDSGIDEMAELGIKYVLDEIDPFINASFNGILYNIEGTDEYNIIEHINSDGTFYIDLLPEIYEKGDIIINLYAMDYYRASVISSFGGITKYSPEIPSKAQLTNYDTTAYYGGNISPMYRIIIKKAQ